MKDFMLNNAIVVVVVDVDSCCANNLLQLINLHEVLYLV